MNHWKVFSFFLAVGFSLLKFLVIFLTEQTQSYNFPYAKAKYGGYESISCTQMCQYCQNF